MFWLYIIYCHLIEDNSQQRSMRTPLIPFLNLIYLDFYFPFINLTYIVNLFSHINKIHRNSNHLKISNKIFQLIESNIFSMSIKINYFDKSFSKYIIYYNLQTWFIVDCYSIYPIRSSLIIFLFKMNYLILLYINLSIILQTELVNRPPILSFSLVSFFINRQNINLI